ncbi:hypothetical protein DP49_4888 [Burkholderia pseudomallei]|nr:hypothetical protein DP49_4888 [Burkholderia pseudomallei]KGS76653.1 hypothetical protein X947_5114 [Burkholderia pseudomallei MSHR7334]KGW44108.1 hypothetical protein Y597_5726 [Burkholderia pseudomallei MSHR1000]KGW97973.1 hypothetical protein Y030_5828 [Burkholderia pseudomallei MSHR332]
MNRVTRDGASGRRTIRAASKAARIVRIQGRSPCCAGAPESRAYLPTWLPTRPPAAAPPIVDRALPPIAAPATPPMPAPIAALRCRVVIVSQADRLAIVAMSIAHTPIRRIDFIVQSSGEREAWARA